VLLLGGQTITIGSMRLTLGLWLVLACTVLLVMFAAHLVNMCAHTVSIFGRKQASPTCKIRNVIPKNGNVFNVHKNTGQMPVQLVFVLQTCNQTNYQTVWLNGPAGQVATQ